MRSPSSTAPSHRCRRTEELAVARAASWAGPPGRAMDGYSPSVRREARRRQGSVRLRHRARRGWAGIAEAAVQFNRVRTPRARAALAAYSRLAHWCARPDQRRPFGAGAGRARVSPWTPPPRHPRFSSGPTWPRTIAPTKRHAAYYRRSSPRYPTSRLRADVPLPGRDDRAAGRTARTAAEEFDELSERYPRSDEAIGAMYWAGRAWAAAGDSAVARSRWQSVASRDPLSY